MIQEGHWRWSHLIAPTQRALQSLSLCVCVCLFSHLNLYNTLIYFRKWLFRSSPAGRPAPLMKAQCRHTLLGSKCLCHLLWSVEHHRVCLFVVQLFLEVAAAAWEGTLTSVTFAGSPSSPAQRPVTADLSEIGGLIVLTLKVSHLTVEECEL